MIQAVISPEHRGGMGMHYTSVPNIMKVIEPLFLNELYEAFEAAKGNPKKLNELLYRLSKIKIFDPACGSGNFLIIAYKELRKLEILILKEKAKLSGKVGSGSLNFGGDFVSQISLSNFYGIELDDFAHEIAQLSLWLAEHQMNVEFFKEFGQTSPTLPLKESGNIVHGNACRLDWEKVCPKKPDSEIYILGNPPYLGARMQGVKQKQDMDQVFSFLSNYRDLDYISVWFFKGAKYITKNRSKVAFVTTNSICQGLQVGLLWPHILDQGISIFFAHTAFKWSNNAKDNAGVTVAIIGISNEDGAQKRLFTDDRFKLVKNINPYLIEGGNSIILRRSKPISEFPEMSFGNMPNDGGGLILNEDEKQEILKKYPDANKFFRRLVGSAEYIRGIDRYCIWLNNKTLEEAMLIPPITERIEIVKNHRLSSKDAGTNKLAKRPHQFRDRKEANYTQIIMPSVSSERREYIPTGFLDKNIVVSNLGLVVYDGESWILGVLTSKMHMIWTKSVGGYLGTSIRYSKDIVYNTFPFPEITKERKEEINQCVFRILGEREKHPEKTLAELYDPDKMPAGLRAAHEANDEVIERCYRSKPFDSDEERLEYLFKLYEKMIAEEKTRGSLFENKKGKKKAKN
ncbi:class I SAM-dependent DNA methyltransferase [Lunatimonas salinarum]|uniref:class I SAM-dependent DNA methyltransferase n=1 Tax=Lunatimonas salinarum TaxID=1774590 RepID=UPI001FD78DD7|nr:DNA methyltransferase [Lunatimonas salinarum]